MEVTIQGTVVRSRVFLDSDDFVERGLVFVQTDRPVNIEGQSYVMIPVILADATALDSLGDHISVTGELVLRQVPTPSGKLTSHAVPVVWIEARFQEKARPAN
ncbi:hypothetical protein [Kyrpidia sp.]|uniref:hypothetical protein n=1 Tax=Kyrpidia sp. TaxID=2073077 RepID=UPI00258E2E94|nr:hypothetical protein [Kyrpidia sp.]MCL6577020.1 hypothetical protein [Kyrpidia sp.]